jgi:pyruvate dehydrogenase E1 component
MGVVIFDGFVHQLPDTDPTETTEWLDSLDAVVDARGRTRARFLIAKVLERAHELQIGVPATVTTPYVNTIPVDQQAWFPGDEHIERRIRAYIRWNAAVMVVRANTRAEGIGGHLATFASSASLYEVGFNHFFHGKDDGLPGDSVYFQGHAAPGIYARAYLEGRLDEEQLDGFRQEVSRAGLSSYPHPRLMPDFWEFPTVSMGLGPINAIYHARFNQYLANRRIADTSGSKVWCFVGDGECDEPETLGALSIAAREKLDNLIFVVNCNLQRLDGPVRGNGKVIQELEAVFRGAGWNVIKVIWGSKWDDLLARDTDGVLLNKMNITVDGQFQKYSVESGEYIREQFFGPDPRLRRMVEHLSHEDLRNLPRGGHDYRKLYAAYKAAVEHEGTPTVILAKTIKGWTLGPDVEGRNATHQIKKMKGPDIKVFRDRLYMQDEVPDEVLDTGADAPYYRPPPGSVEYEYLMERRQALDGALPKRGLRRRRQRLDTPEAEAFKEFREGSGGKGFSTTMAFARLLRNLVRDPKAGKRVVPIIPDEARTFGLDALFREIGIYSAVGQLYEPVDADLLLTYREHQTGQILEEGITEAGSMATFTAAGTSYATQGKAMLPFYIFYSMFGFQRTGDLMWAAADARARGFLLGATAGRTTLNGEGLQHQDGHSHLLMSVLPNCVAYDPAFAYEMAMIIEDGCRRMLVDEEDVLYYLTLYNENYAMPPMPKGVEKDLLQGLYRFEAAPGKPSKRATILFSGPAWQAAVEARDELAAHWDVGAELWSATSYKALREEALSTERWNRLHPSQSARTPWVTQKLSDAEGPYVAVTDYMKAVPDMIHRWVPGTFEVLGTDGFGRSDTREALRRHFEVDAGHVVVATLHALATEGQVKGSAVTKAIAKYRVDPEALDPRLA